MQDTWLGQARCPRRTVDSRLHTGWVDLTVPTSRRGGGASAPWHSGGPSANAVFSTLYGRVQEQQVGPGVAVRPANTFGSGAPQLVRAMTTTTMTTTAATATRIGSPQRDNTP